MLKASYCDRLLSGVCHAVCVICQHLLLSNQLWDETLQKASFQRLYHNSFKFLGSIQNSGFHGNQTKKTLKFFFSQTSWPIFKLFFRNVLWMSLYHIPSSHVDWSKNMASRGRGYFALQGYSENLRSLLL